MRTLRINRDKTIDEIDADPDEWMDDHDWDAARLDDVRHDVWVHDEGLFEPGVVVATIGDRTNLPLPAWITGYDGDEMAAATLTVDELRGMLR